MDLSEIVPFFRREIFLKALYDLLEAQLAISLDEFKEVFVSTVSKDVADDCLQVVLLRC